MNIMTVGFPSIDDDEPIINHECNLPSPPHNTSFPSIKSRVLKFLSAGRSGRKQEAELFDSVKNASTCLPGSRVNPPDITSTADQNISYFLMKVSAHLFHHHHLSSPLALVSSCNTIQPPRLISKLQPLYFVNNKILILTIILQ